MLASQQLPPTILSLDKHGKKTKPSDLSKSPSAQEPESANAVPLVEEEDLSDDSLEGDVVLERENSELESTLVALDIKTENTKANTGKPKRAMLKPPRTLETTLFERLERMYGAGIKRMLKVQYR